MQTFVPTDDLFKCARVLDDRRLGNQRRECNTILGALDPEHGNGWRHHAAVKMWRGPEGDPFRYEPALRLYLAHIVSEWVLRGNRNQVRAEIPNVTSIVMPPWWGDERIHASHRAALLFKFPTWYAQWGWGESPRVSYVWPNPALMSGVPSPPLNPRVGEEDR